MKMLALLWLASCAPRPPVALEPAASPPSTPRAYGPPPKSADYAEVDLLRTTEGGSRVYVQAAMPDGSAAIFLVDTGATLSVISADLSAQLGLERVDVGLRVSGLSGEVAIDTTAIPWVDIGGVVVPGVLAAVDVPGMPETFGGVPLGGILGNNVWGGLVLALDYPADVLELGRPGRVEVPETAAPMEFVEGATRTQLVVTAGAPGEPPVEHALVIELDTGAGGLLLSGQGFDPLLPLVTEGEEPIRGLGASTSMPVSAFYRRTRRVPMQSVTLGGVTRGFTDEAVWINYDGESFGPRSLIGLAGHQLFEEHRVVFDFPGGRFAMAPSERPPRLLNGHTVLLAQELEQHGEPAERGLYRAKLRVGFEDFDGARADLDAYLALTPDDGEAQVLRARIDLVDGDRDAWLARVEAMPLAELLEQGEAVALINALILDGRAADALDVAKRSLAEDPSEAHGLLALSDALLATGDFDGARRALSDAARASANPDAYLTRRARASMAEGDELAALAHLRRQLTLYPSDGQALWYYALLVAPEGLGGQGYGAFAATAQADIDRAMARLHPSTRPLDFLMAAERLLGEPPEALTPLRDEGIATSCEPLEELADRDNCTAWFLAMWGAADDEALALIRGALEAEPHNTAYLDTLAVVHLVRGELAEAEAAAIEAARLEPSSFYLLWQAERVSRVASAAANR